MMKNIFFAVAAVVSTVAFGGVYDDAIWWFNKPYDTGSKPGVLETGEMLDALTGGVPAANQHKGVVYGYDESRSNVTMTVKTAYFEKNLPVAFFTDVVEDSLKFPGNADISVPLKDLRPETITEFSSVTRFNWDGNSHSTAWLYGANSGKLVVGVISGKIRVWPSDAVGGTTGIPTLPVTANKWYDLGVSIVKGGGADGKNLLNIILVNDDGTKYTYVDDTYSGFPDPAYSAQFNFATQDLKKSAASSPNKYFTGAIQQMVFWNRALSEDEFLEAFAYSNGDKVLVGVANASGDEFGGTGTDIVMDGDWKDVPKTLAAGGSYTVKFAGTAEVSQTLAVKGASGATTLKVGNDSVDIAEGGEVSFCVPRTSLAVEDGVASFTLQNTGSTALALDCLSLTDTDTRITTNSVTYTSHIEDPIEVPQDTVLVINVPEGCSVELQGVVSGGGQIVKVGAGTLKPTAANTLTGGFAVREGALCSAGGTFGSGPVTVIANGTTPSQLSLNGTFANNIYVEGESSDACPAIHFADTTTLNGNLIASNAVVYLSTAWEDTAAQADKLNVTFNGALDVTGGTIALAPHCRVDFVKQFYCDLLKLYWRPNAASVDGGNPGIVGLPSWGDRLATGACGIKHITIDQTRIFALAQNPFGGGNSASYQFAVVEWTGEHKTGGSINLNLQKCCWGEIITPPTTLDDMESMRVFNGSGWNNFYATPASTLYLRFETTGPLQVGSGSGVLTFANRRQRIASDVHASASTIVFSNEVFEAATRFSVNGKNGKITIQDCTDPYALWNIGGFVGAQRGTIEVDDSALATLRDYGYCVSVSAAQTLTFSLPENTILKAGWLSDNAAKPAGIYGKADLTYIVLPESCQIWSAAESANAVNLGNIRWDGEKWVDAIGGEVTPGVAAGYQIVQASGGTATLSTATDVNLYGISLAVNGESLTLNSQDDKTISVWNGGLRVEGDAIDAGSSYTFNAPIMLQGTDAYIQIPTNGTCALNGGISGQGNVTLNGSADAACGHPSPYAASATKGETDGGVFYLNGDNTFSGNLTASNAVFHLKGTLGLPGDTSTFYARADSGQDANKVYHHYMGNFYFKGFDCYKAMDVKSGSSSDPNYGYAVIFDEGTTNTFHSTFHWNSSTIVRFLADSQTMFKKTVTFDNSVKLYPMAGAVLDFEGPFKAPNAEKANVGIEGRAGTHLIFNSKGNVSGTFLTFNGADMVIDINETDAFQIGTYFQLGSAVDNTCTLNLNNGARISAPEFLTSENVTVHGEGVGAAVEITDGSKEKHAVKCQLTGTAGLVMSGAGTCSVSGCRGLSTGELVAQAGVISMDAASTWAGAVRVCGGTLNLTGVKKVAAIYVNNSTESLPEGLYGAVGSGAPHEVAWITGTGKLRIGNAGMLFIVK